MTTGYNEGEDCWLKPLTFKDILPYTKEYLDLMHEKELQAAGGQRKELQNKIVKQMANIHS